VLEPDYFYSVANSRQSHSKLAANSRQIYLICTVAATLPRYCRDVTLPRIYRKFTAQLPHSYHTVAAILPCNYRNFAAILSGNYCDIAARLPRIYRVIPAISADCMGV
jgi:hypothetical protein